MTADVDKDRAVAHYVPMAAEAARLPATRRAPLRRPNLSLITGWQYDRRRAVAMLGYLEEQARRDGDTATEMAMWSAAYDLRTLLADRAASLNEESVAMYYAHADTWQGNVAHHRRAVRGEVTA